MRIAVVHSYYSDRVPSGENVVVDLQIAALRRAGHDVLVISRRQEDVEGSPFYRAVTGLRVATNRGPMPVREIDRFDPEIIHVHNLFPNFGRSWARRYPSRVVVTIHNYRPMCVAATLLRGGTSCTLCPDGHTTVPAVKYRCFKESRVATLPLAIGTKFDRDPLLAAAARIITINDDMRTRYAAVGIPEGKIVTVPNFVPAPVENGGGDGDQRDDHWLFVGRLTDEKGILPLIHEWPEGHRLNVIGSGPLEEHLREIAPAGVEFLGQQPGAEVARYMNSARGLLFPSIWPEGLPTVYLEALAAGLPVIAGTQSIVGHLVTRDGTGIVMTDSLADDLERGVAEFPGLGSHCRRIYDGLYTESAWLAAVQSIYAEVSAEAR